MGTTQGEMVVPKFFPRKGPRGTYSHAWMSRAGRNKQTEGCIPYDPQRGASDVIMGSNTRQDAMNILKPWFMEYQIGNGRPLVLSNIITLVAGLLNY